MNADIISLAVANAYEQMLATDSAWGSELESVDHFRQMVLMHLGVSDVQTCCWNEDEDDDEDS